jgi:hypothetical protein
MESELSITPQAAPHRTKRPKLVWIITIFCLISAGWTLLSFILIYSGSIPVSETQAAYLRSQNIVDMLCTVLIVLLNLVGALHLFLLRQRAYHMFLSAFILGLVMTIYHILFKNWLTYITAPGLFGAAIGWGVSIAIIIYTKRRAKAGTLK